MDHFSRLIGVCLLALLWPLASYGYGQVPKVNQKLYYCAITGYWATRQAASVAAACGAVFDLMKAERGHGVTWTSGEMSGSRNFFMNGVVSYGFVDTCSGNGCGSPSVTVNPAGYFQSGVASEAVMCTQGASELANGKCECSLGTRAVFVGGEAQCQPYQCPPKGSYSSVTQPDMTVTTVGTQCADGCAVNPSSTKVAADGSLYATWPFISTGAYCGGKSDSEGIGTGSTLGQPAPVPCGPNLCPGTVNGASICVACTKVDSAAVPGPSSSASGVTPSNDTANQIDKSSQSTSCSGGVCTTTTNYYNNAGQQIGSKTESDNQDSFCAKNPALAICKTSSFGGSCGATSCTGDPVQCALTQEIVKRNCQLYDTPNELSVKGSSLMNDAAVPPGHPGASPGSVDLGAAFGSVNEATPACPVDKTVSVGGKSFAIPLSKTCDPFRWMGHIAYAFALLSAGFFLMRKVA